MQLLCAHLPCTAWCEWSMYTTVHLDWQAGILALGQRRYGGAKSDCVTWQALALHAFEDLTCTLPRAAFVACCNGSVSDCCVRLQVQHGQRVINAQGLLPAMASREARHEFGQSR